MERKSQGRPAEASCGAVVDGPHEPKRPGANQFHEEDPGDQGEAVRHAAHRVLGILQQGSDQESLGDGRGGKERREEVKYTAEKQ